MKNLMHCKFDYKQGRTTLLLCMAPSFAKLQGVLIYSYGGVNCLNSVPYYCHKSYEFNLADSNIRLKLH